MKITNPARNLDNLATSTLDSISSLDLKKPGLIMDVLGQRLYFKFAEKVGQINEADKGSIGKVLINDFSFNNSDNFDIVQISKIKTFSSDAIKALDINWQSSSFNDFEKEFKLAQTLFEEQEVEKIVLSSFEKNQESTDYLKSLEYCLKKSLKYQFKNSDFYTYWDGINYFICGFSPEKLYEWDQKKIYTYAIAGTNFEDKNIKLLEDHKELKEHQLVVQGLSESLTKYGKLKVDKPTTYRTNGLEHLISPIYLNHSSPPSLEIIKDLHPSPAIGGFPKKIASDTVHKLYPNRGLYSGCISLLLDNYHKSLVCIRNIQYIDSHLYLYSGCGIVKESTLDNEWQELIEKRKGVKRLLDLD